MSKETPAQGMSAGTDETLEAAQGAARQPGPKDAPGTQANPTPTDVNTLIERLTESAEHLRVMPALDGRQDVQLSWASTRLTQAAQALRAMQARVGALEEALAPFAIEYDDAGASRLDDAIPWDEANPAGDMTVTVGDFRRARSTQQEAQRHGEDLS